VGLDDLEHCMRFEDRERCMHDKMEEEGACMTIYMTERSACGSVTERGVRGFKCF